MKRIIKLSGILLIVLAVLFLGTFIVLYSGIFPILTGFNVNSVINTHDTIFSISFDKVRASKYYIVEIHDSKDELLYKKKIETNEYTQDFGFIQENEEYKLDVYAYNKKDESRKSNNTYEFTYQKEVSFTKDNSAFLNNETGYLYLSRMVDTKNYSISITKNTYDEQNNKTDSKFVKEDMITNDVYEINESLFKDEKVELVVELKKNSNTIDKISLYNNMYPQEKPEISYPENGSTLNLSDVYLKFNELTWADRYEISIITSDNKVIATTSTEENEALLDSSIFDSGVYTISVNAFIGDYSTNSSTMFKIEKRPSSVYLSKDVNSIKKGDTIELLSNSSGSIYYTIDGTDPINGGLVYNSPIKILEDTTIKALILEGGKFSNTRTYNIKINNNKKDIKVFLSSSNQYFNIGEEPFTNERKEMNLISDLISNKLSSKGVTVYRNDYLSSYQNILNECRDNNVNLLVSLETTSSYNHDKSGLQTLVATESSKGFSLANIINNKLKKLKDSKIVLTNDIKGSKTKEENDLTSVMIELGYHDNKTDAEFLVNNRESIAEEIADSILRYYGIN